METMVQPIRNEILRQALPLITENWHRVPGFAHYGPAPRLSRLAMGGELQPALFGRSDRARHAGLAVIDNYLGSLVLVNATSAFLDLPRDFPYAGLLLRFTASVVISGGTT